MPGPLADSDGSLNFCAHRHRTTHLEEYLNLLRGRTGCVSSRLPGLRRADARRNLDKLRAAAAEAFSERGLDMPLEEIASRGPRRL